MCFFMNVLCLSMSLHIFVMCLLSNLNMFFLTMKKFRLVVLMCCMTMVVSAQGQNDSTAERSVKLQELVVKESLVKHSAKSDNML